jgi:hypothetical protein
LGDNIFLDFQPVFLKKMVVTIKMRQTVVTDAKLKNQGRGAISMFGFSRHFNHATNGKSMYSSIRELIRFSSTAAQEVRDKKGAVLAPRAKKPISTIQLII